MKRRKKNNIIFLFALLVLFISMGYALISTQLIINGETIISRNVWSVYWDNPVVAEGSVSNTLPVLSAEAGKTLNTILTWEVSLNKPGEFYEFTVDAVNNGTIDAMISGISSTITDSNDDPVELPEYIKYSLTYDDSTTIANNHLLAKASGIPTTEKYKVKVYYDETVVTRNDINNMESGVLYNFSLGITYSQADSNAFIRDKGTFLNGMDLNVKIKKLAGNSSATSSSVDSNIRAIKHSLVEPTASNKQEANVVSVEGTQYLIYMWYEGGTLYWWSLDEKPAFNADSRMVFCRLLNLSDLEGLRDIDVSKAVILFGIFYDCVSIQNVNDLADWDVSSVKNMGWLFGIQDVITNAGYHGSLNDLTGLSNWDVSSVQTMNQMFINIDALTNLHGLENWHIDSLTNMSCMFEMDTALTNIEAIGNWDVSNVTNMYALFWADSSLANLEAISEWDTGKVESFERTFNNCTGLTSIEAIEEWDTSSVTTMEFMFSDCINLTSVDLSGWDGGNLITMRGMFYECSALTSADLSNLNATKLDDMAGIFISCSSLTSANLSNSNTISLTNMYCMFYECTSLTSVNLSNFITSNVTDMTAVFCNCTKLTSLDLSSFYTSNVTTMESMFDRCYKLTSIDMSNFGMSKVTNTRCMFQYCSVLQNIVLPNNYKRIDDFMFNQISGYNQESFTIPKSVTFIGKSHMFYNFGKSSKFKKFIVEEGSTTLKTIDDVLYTYDGTRLIAIPRAKTFENNTYIVPEGVAFMNELSFSNNATIQSIVLPNSYEIIRYIKANNNEYGFINSGNSLSIAIYRYTSIASYEVKEDNPRYISYEGCLYNLDGTELVAVPFKYSGVLNVKEGTTTIGQEAFWDFENIRNSLITEINIPASVTSIEANQITTLNKLITSGVVINIDSNNTVYEISNSKIVTK